MDRDNDLTMTTKRCRPIEAGTPPLTLEKAESMLGEARGWSIRGEGTRLSRSFKFRDFSKAFEFVKEVAIVAESEDHHPDIRFGYGYCRIDIQTHKIGGLSENDFILAAKISAVAAMHLAR